MMKSPLEVADVFREGEARFLAEYGHTLSREQRQVLRAVIRCRTAQLGGHLQKCDDCGHQRIQYNSCRNRHCPKCQAMARAAWLEKRQSELLPVPYFHVVFTLPHELGPLALQNKRVVYGLLFRAAARTLLEVGAEPEAPGSEDRLSDGAAHVGPKPDASSARACDRHRRRPLRRWFPLDSRQARANAANRSSRLGKFSAASSGASSSTCLKQAFRSRANSDFSAD